MFPENSNNMLVKAVSFYLKGFQRYGVLKKCIIFSVILYFFRRSGSSSNSNGVTHEYVSCTRYMRDVFLMIYQNNAAHIRLC